MAKTLNFGDLPRGYCELENAKTAEELYELVSERENQ
jgi:hypothetical protein